MVGIEVLGQETTQREHSDFYLRLGEQWQHCGFGEISYCKCSQPKLLEVITLEYIEKNVD